MYIYTICICIGVTSTLGLESEETSLLFFYHMFFFFATKSENRNKVWSFHRQLCLGDATGVLPTRTTEAGFFPPWTGGQVSFGGRENSQPGFCALFLWAPGNVRLKCAGNRLCTKKSWRIFFHSKLWKFFWCPTFEKFENTAPGD